MNPGKLNPDYLRDLMEGTQRLHQYEGRSFSYIDEIVLDRDTMELRWRGKTLITYDLPDARRQAVSIGMEVRLD